MSILFLLYILKSWFFNIENPSWFHWLFGKLLNCWITIKFCPVLKLESHSQKAHCVIFLFTFCKNIKLRDKYCKSKHGSRRHTCLCKIFAKIQHTHDCYKYSSGVINMNPRVAAILNKNLSGWKVRVRQNNLQFVVSWIKRKINIDTEVCNFHILVLCFSKN